MSKIETMELAAGTEGINHLIGLPIIETKRWAIVKYIPSAIDNALDEEEEVIIEYFKEEDRLGINMVAGNCDITISIDSEIFDKIGELLASVRDIIKK